MRLRVVWGLFETMETFWPRMRFSSVDLPAFGRPTRATTPNFISNDSSQLSALSSQLSDLCSVLSRRFFVRERFRISRDFHAVNAALVGALDAEPEAVFRDD